MDYTVYNMKRIEDERSLKHIDILVFFSTDEERSWNVVEHLSSHHKLPNQVLALCLAEEAISPKFNEEKYKNIDFYQSSIDKDLSRTLIPCLIDINARVHEKKAIGIDISAMPIPVFSQILHFLLEKHKDKKVIIYYTEPGHYDLNNLFDFSAFNGEIDIKSIPGFEGKTAKKSEAQRIVFYILGFEMNYLNRLIPQETNPDSIIPINGFPSYFPKYKDISLVNNNVNYHELDVPVVYAEANNPFETFNLMCLLEKQHSDYCIDIIPAGTKPMALGACLFALRNKSNSIRVLFPFPTEYKNHQSSGNGTIWQYVID